MISIVQKMFSHLRYTYSLLLCKQMLKLCALKYVVKKTIEKYSAEIENGAINFKYFLKTIYEIFES